jgi:hypothetical protein
MPESTTQVFISYAHPDRAYGSKLKELLGSGGVQSVDSAMDLKVGASNQFELQERIAEVSTTMVLLGPDTRKSRWVDFEVETAVRGFEARPGTALIAVVLPNHEDFRKPYYDPELVPLRVHDLILQEYALLRKWTEDLSEILRWIDEAQRRRQRIRCPSISFKTSFAIREFDWDATVDNSSDPTEP